jgi:hypothetical protein
MFDAAFRSTAPAAGFFTRVVLVATDCSAA